MAFYVFPANALVTSQRTSRVQGLFCLVAMAGIFGGLLLDGLHLINKGNFGAFATYHEAAKLLRSGGSPYGNLNTYPYVYPPFWAWLYQVLLPLSYANAARVVFFVNAGLFAGAIVLSAQSILRRLTGSCSLATTLPVSLITTLLVAVEVQKGLKSYQTDVVLLAGFVLAIYCLDRWPRIAGGALAFAASVKYLPLIAAPYLILRRRWKALAALVAGLFALALLPASTLGVRLNLHYLNESVGGLAHLVNPASIPASRRAALNGSVARVHGLTAETDHSASSAVGRGVAALHWSPTTALVLIGLLASAWFGYVCWSTSGGLTPAVRWPSSAGQTAFPYRQRIAIEWAGLMVVAMVFNPAAALVLGIYLAALSATLLVCFPTARRDLGVVGGTILFFLAMLLPFSEMGHAFTLKWNMSGASCWLLLVSSALLTRGALPLLGHSNRETASRESASDLAERPHGRMAVPAHGLSVD